MSSEDKLELIKEVILNIDSGDQYIDNGLEEIQFILEGGVKVYFQKTNDLK